MESIVINFPFTRVSDRGYQIQLELSKHRSALPVLTLTDSKTNNLPASYHHQHHSHCADGILNFVVDQHTHQISHHHFAEADYGQHP